MIVDALKGKYPLPALQEKLKMAKSSYCYQRTCVSFSAKHEDDRRAIAAIFHDNKQQYGYRRIKMVLNRGGYILSEKIIRRIMRFAQEYGLRNQASY